MRLKLINIAGYLPYEVYFQINAGNNIKFVGTPVQLDRNGDIGFEVEHSFIVWEQIENITPVLYPFELAKPIIHNGEEEIPLVELAKIYFTYNSKLFDFNLGNNNEVVITSSDRNIFKGLKYIFYYQPSTECFILENKYGSTLVRNTYYLYSYLYSRKINFRNIKAIDPNSLSKNPYL